MPLIFVVGNSRSGTTMMGRILNNHSEIHTFPELHFFEQLWSGRDRGKVLEKEATLHLTGLLLNISREGYFAKKHPQDFREEALHLLNLTDQKEFTATGVFNAVIRFEAARNGKKFPCDQTPQNVFYTGEILELFPDSRFINMIRDPRDVLLSQKRKWKRRFLGGTHATWFETVRAWTNYHPITISKLWNSAIRAGQNRKDDRVLDVQFEKLIESPDETIAAICRHIRVSFTTGLKEVPHMGSSSGMDQKDVKGIRSDRSQSWIKGGLNVAEIWFCQQICRNYMKQFGYEPDNQSPGMLRLLFYYLIFPVKLGLALLLNLHRMKNIAETIRKRLR